MNEREEFLKELHALLGKYDVEITAQNHWQGYAECGEDVRMTAEFNSWETDDIDLGKWVDKDKHGGNG